MTNSQNEKEVWITGIGIVSSLGEGLDAHWQALTAEKPETVVDDKTFAPYSIHPICDIDYSKQIPKRGDLRQMEDWQRIGTYAAGLALDDAGIKGNEELLAKTSIIAAAGNGERDPQADATVLAALAGDPDWRNKLNDLLLTNLRPTLYLAQQTQLLAGNISIVHKVTGGSRTFKGEEIAGVQILENAVERIQAGQGELFLVGAACNAARWDQLLIREMNGCGDRQTGSMGAFIVVESRHHAEKRHASPSARLSYVKVSSTGTESVMVFNSRHSLELSSEWNDENIAPPSVHLLGQTGRSVAEGDTGDQLRSTDLGELFGHGIEAQFPMAVALAAMQCAKGNAEMMISSKDMYSGRGMAKVERLEE